ncbi:MAG: FAD-dependent oxidoreductase [Pirellulaceae bacterium]|nr:FAD-dependent oxidoreductase [Pirellulaceae bacterium]
MQSEALRLYSEAEARREASRCLGCGDPTCMDGCPAKVDIREFIHEIATGNLTRSARLLMEKNPFYWSCAYICPVEKQCEIKCHYAEINYPVTIARLQQYVANRDWEEGIFRPSFAEPTGAKAAIIGGGPAGMTCAWQLARRGIQSVLYERRKELGGMLGWAIPGYRLPDEIRNREIDRLRCPMIEVRQGEAAPPAVSLLERGFDAVFVAPGLQASARVNLPGEEFALFALDVMDMAHRGILDMQGKRVLVVGGGSVAMDVCGTALRAGAEKVELICPEAPREMPAARRELDDAWEKGTIFHTRLLPIEIVVEDGRVEGLRAVGIEWIEEGRFVPSNARVLPGTERFLPGTVVVEAIGQRPGDDCGELLTGLEHNGGLVAVDQETMSTSVPGVFAGGDVVNGGSTVAAAVDHGNRAAEAIAARAKRLAIM